MSRQKRSEVWQNFFISLKGNFKNTSQFCNIIYVFSGSTTPGRGLRLLRRNGRLFGVSLTRLCNGTPPPALVYALRRLRVVAPLTHGVFRRSANAKALRLLRDKVRTYHNFFSQNEETLMFLFFNPMAQKIIKTMEKS